MLPVIQSLKIQVATLEKEKEALKESLESTQVEVEGLKEQSNVTEVLPRWIHLLRLVGVRAPIEIM